MRYVATSFRARLIHYSYQEGKPLTVNQSGETYLLRFEHPRQQASQGYSSWHLGYEFRVNETGAFENLVRFGNRRREVKG